MSSLSIPRPKKLSDGQFIGDLTKLLERRKIKCGDPLSLESFGSELTSNTILRSDLFTLCTAISHMAEEDLSGEQLLVLVGRAVGGTEVCRGDGAVEIPDNMRSAFLTGFEAWGKRGSEPNEPLPWPPPRPQLARSEPPPEADDAKAGPDPVASKPPASGLHSIQEALEIAKKRSPTGLAQPPRSAAAGANVDGLTMSELKTLLEDIEHRMSRIQPHLSQLNSMVDSPEGDSRRPKRGGEFEDVIPFRAAAPAESRLPFGGRSSPSLAGSLAAMADTEAAIRQPPVVDVSEDAFLARHAYLKPSRRNLPDVKVLPVVSVDELALMAPAIPPVEVPVAISPAPVASVPVAQPVAAPVDAPIATAWVLAPSAAPDLMPTVASETEVAPEITLNEINPIEAALVYMWEGLNVSPGLMLAVAAIVLVVPTWFAGLFVYNYLHPKPFMKYPVLKTAEVTQAPDVPADSLAGLAPATPARIPDVAAGASVRRAVSSPHLVARQPAIAHDVPGRDATQQARPISKPQSQAYVWPPPPDRISAEETPPPPRPLVAAATSMLPVSTISRPSRLSGPPPSAIYVPSSTMIKYAVSAPKPVYPVAQAKGMDGTVVLQITISKQGDVTSVRAISGPIEFRSAAVQAVRAWRFQPYLFNGNPAEVETMLEIPFRSQ